MIIYRKEKHIMSKIIYKNNNPFIEINGELIPPAAFRSFRPQPFNVAQFHRMGVRLFQMQVAGKTNALGDMYSLYGPVWIGDHKYDFTAFDRQIQMFMKYAPDGYFCIMVLLDTPDWWLQENPDIPDSFFALGKSVISEKWKKDAADYLQAFIEYAEKNYGDRIFAYSYACGLCTEWFMDDHGAPTAAKLLAYRKYLNDDNAEIPILTNENDGEESDLREPFSNQKKYMDYCCRLNSDLVVYFAEKAQEIINHEKLIGVFYGYIDQGTAFKQNLWFTNIYDSVWKCMDIDMLFSPASYNDNRDFDGVPLYQYAVDSLPICNKLYLHEMDHRTDLSLYPLSTGRFMWDCYETAKESIAVLRRELCNAMLKNSALWWFDFYGGYFSTPEYEQELSKHLKIYNELNTIEHKQVAEIAVFVDAPSMNYMKERTDLVPECVRCNLTELVKSGAMIETFNLNDIKNIDKDKYKLFVFLDALCIPDDIVEFINSELSDKYKFYVYAPNIVGEKLDYKRISNITGMDIATLEKTSHARTAQYNSVSFGFSKPVVPEFEITDDSIEVIARYNDEKVCTALKNKTFYSTVGNIPYQLWQYAEKVAGVHIYSENGCYVAASSAFVAMQNAKSEECKITMPYDCELEELFDGGIYKTVDKKLCYQTSLGDTKLFKIIKKY